MDREKKYLFIALLISVLILIAAYLLYQLGPNLNTNTYVSRYVAVLKPGGVYEETITYSVYEEGHHILYRSWHTVLSFNSSKEYIEPLKISCPAGFIPYIYTHNKQLVVQDKIDSETYEKLRKILEEYKASNEVGCYNPYGIPPGEYIVKYEYSLYPTLYCNTTHCLFDFYIAYQGEHIDYENFTFRVVGGDIVFYAPRSLTSQVKEYLRGDKTSTISVGFIDEGQSLRTLIIVPIDYFSESTTRIHTSNLRDFIEKIIADVIFSENLVNILSKISFALVFIIPIFCMVLYVIGGRERKDLLKYIDERIPPETGEKPWLVNLLYAGDVGIFTKEVFAATILDLISRGILEVRKTFSISGEDVVLTLREYNSGELDEYEERVLRVLKKLSVDGKNIGLKRIEEVLKNKRKLKDIMDEAKKVYDPKPYKDYVRKAVKSYRKILGILFIVTVIYWIGSLFFILTSNSIGDNYPVIRTFAESFLAAMMWVPWLALPAYVLGRWNDEYVVKFYSWMKFIDKVKKMNLLENPSAEMLGGKTAKIVAYLIALGETRYVINKFKRTDHELLRLYQSLLFFFTTTYPRYFYPRRSGAGGGGGGGFGGGGAGVR